jgi:hypothetical protein
LLTRARLIVASGAIGVAAGAGLLSITMAASEPSPGPRPQIVSSSTNLQSFLWVYDDAEHVVTFCFTAASPANGPQYDFSCRRHALADGGTPN